MISTMQTFDTLKIYERLKNAKAGEELAKEVAEILRETTEERLASKNDLKNTEVLLQNDLKNTEIRLGTEIEKVKHELRAEIEKTRIEVTAKIASEVNKSKVEIIKWVVGLLLAQAGLIGALVKLT
ncbi:MAG: hypothetical protein OEV66_05185 [Spirochaetia bacterium]|nr:hypothetical protein [Spirochaetia bacterium]